MKSTATASDTKQVDSVRDAETTSLVGRMTNSCIAFRTTGNGINADESVISTATSSTRQSKTPPLASCHLSAGSRQTESLPLYDVLDVSGQRDDAGCSSSEDVSFLHDGKRRALRRIVPRMGTRAFVGVKLNEIIAGCRGPTGNQSADIGKPTTSSALTSSVGGNEDNISTDSCDSDRRLAACDVDVSRRRDVRGDGSGNCKTNRRTSTVKAGGSSSSLSESYSSESEIASFPSMADDSARSVTVLSSFDVRHFPATVNGKHFRRKPDAPFDESWLTLRAGDEAKDDVTAYRQGRESGEEPVPPATTMLTNRAHLAHTIMVQQRLFQQQMLAVQRRQIGHYRQRCDASSPDGAPWTAAAYEHQYEEIPDRATPPTPPPLPHFATPRPPGSRADLDRQLARGRTRHRVSPDVVDRHAECVSTTVTGGQADSGDGRPDGWTSVGNRDLVDNGADVIEWVVKRRSDGTRHIARRTKKPAVTASRVDACGGLESSSKNSSRDASRDAAGRTRRRQSSIDSVPTKPEVETRGTATSRHLELQAAILNLLPAAESRPLFCAGNATTQVDNVGQMARSNRALLSVTTM